MCGWARIASSAAAACNLRCSAAQQSTLHAQRALWRLVAGAAAPLDFRMALQRQFGLCRSDQWKYFLGSWWCCGAAFRMLRRCSVLRPFLLCFIRWVPIQPSNTNQSIIIHFYYFNHSFRTIIVSISCLSICSIVTHQIWNDLFMILVAFLVFIDTRGIASFKIKIFVFLHVGSMICNSKKLNAKI